MARFGGGAVIAVCALAIAGCGGQANDTAATTAATTTAVGAPKLGDALAFVRAGDRSPIGTIRFLQVVALPAGCAINPAGAQTVAIEAEIVNQGPLFLPAPDPFFTLQVVDGGGYTQRVSSVALEPECRAAHPAIAASQPSGKTRGWAFIDVKDANPTALMYAAVVGEADSTIDNLKLVTVSPPTVQVPLPVPLPTAQFDPSPAPASTVPPVSTTASPRRSNAAPAAGQACDVSTDTWAKDSAGGQLRCAYAGAPTPRWVQSAPYVGVREPGTRCELGAAVAESAEGQTLVCVGERGASTWAPGP